eukprot:jgi/Tetstr1/464957/TSEL_009691.t1
MASASTFHNAAGPDDASWKGFMLQSGSPEPPPAPRGPPLRYYLTTVSADRSSNVSDGVKLNGPLTTARLREASSTANQAAQGVYVFTSLAEAQDETYMGFDAAYVCSCDWSQLEEAGFRVAGGGLIQLYTRPTAVSPALKHHFDAAFDAFYPIDGVTGLPYMDAEIPGYTKGHIIKRFKELAATATGLAHDIIPGAPTDYVLRKRIQKAARSRRRNWPLSKKWPERKTQVIQLWAATLWGRYYTESVTKGTTAVPPPYLTVEEEQAALLNSTSSPGQKWAASLVVSRVRAAGIEEDEKDMRKRVTRGRPDAKVRKLMAASSTAQPPGVVKTLTDDKKRKRPVKKRRGKKLTVAESEVEAEAARSSKRRVPRALKNKNKQ